MSRFTGSFAPSLSLASCNFFTIHLNQINGPFVCGSAFHFTSTLCLSQKEPVLPPNGPPHWMYNPVIYPDCSLNQFHINPLSTPLALPLSLSFSIQSQCACGLKLVPCQNIHFISTKSLRLWNLSIFRIFLLRSENPRSISWFSRPLTDIISGHSRDH